MRSIALLMVAFLVLAFESPLLTRVHLAPYAPDFALLFTLYVGFTSRLEAGLAVVVMLGLLKDAFALSTPVGMHTEILILAFLLSYRISRRLALRGPVGVVVLALLVSVGASLAELLLSLVFDRTFGAGPRGVDLILRAMLPQALLTAPFGPLVFWIADRTDRLVTRKSEPLYLER